MTFLNNCIRSLKRIGKSNISQSNILKLYKLYRISMNPINSLEIAFGKRDEITPPRGLNSRAGAGDFETIGNEFLNYFIEFGKLKRDDKILDVGSGIGRMAIPLTKYLKKEGEYAGFDVFKDGIKWSQEKITKKYPNFQFQFLDLFNGKYNPDGKLNPSTFKFPYKEKHFDFVFATSVFTHMLPNDLKNYLSQINHVLKDGGRCLFTFFLLIPESTNLIKQKKSALDFFYGGQNYKIIDDICPEGSVAYDEDFLLNLFSSNGFNIIEPIHYGNWCGRTNYVSYQDIIIVKKN